LDTPLLTPRLIIRRLEPSDAEAMFRYRSDPVISSCQNWEPGSVEEVRTFIAGLAKIDVDTPGRWCQVGLFLRDSGEMVGDCGIHAHPEDPGQTEVGITLARSFHRRGLGTEALRAVLGYLFTTLGKHRVFASVDPANAPSLAMLERVGMRREAHFVESLWFKGRWADDVVYAMLSREYTGRASR
jgi:RimJ/RimL family protein N-acetyltransferase